MCHIAATKIEATSRKIEQAVGNIIEVFANNYERIKERSKPRCKREEPDVETPEEVDNYLT